MRSRSNIEKIHRLENEINQIAEMYFSAISSKNDEEVLYDSEEELSDYERFVLRIRRAFESLNKEEQLFINNEFFYQDYPNWWKKRYSKAAFFKIRNRSMKRFKEAFDHEA